MNKLIVMGLLAAGAGYAVGKTDLPVAGNASGCGISQTDIIVIGGTHAGVEAALAAQSAGAKVALFESRPALGGDKAGKLLLETTDGKLTTPLAIRQTLDERLLRAKLPFRTWVYVKDILRDANGQVAGVTVVSRSGERIIPAKSVIDATERAYAARRAGSEFRPFPSGKYRVRRRVVSGEVARVAYAHVLGMLGSPIGAPALIEKLRGATWDEGWNYRGMSQFGRPVSQLDSYIIALAKSRASSARPVIAALAAQLDSAAHYSHFRAVALYFEALGDKQDAAILEALLTKPGIGGYAFAWERDGAPAIPEYDIYNFKSKRAELCQGAAGVSEGERSRCLRELVLARALYRLGDRNGRARSVLESYMQDPRRAYSCHARQVLERGKLR